jgi:hypothetical protein
MAVGCPPAAIFSHPSNRVGFLFACGADGLTGDPSPAREVEFQIAAGPGVGAGEIPDTESQSADTPAPSSGRIERETRAIIPPIQLSTTFERAPDTCPGGRSYIRDNNPAHTAQDLLRRPRAGPIALLAWRRLPVFLALQPGDHVIAPRTVYYGVRVFLSERPGMGDRGRFQTRRISPPRQNYAPDKRA